MNATSGASAWNWWEVANAGWFSLVVGTFLSVLGLGAGYYFYKRSLPMPRLRFALSDNVVMGQIEQPLVNQDQLEVRFGGVPVPRVTSTTFGIWNDGRQIFRGEDLVARDPLRLAIKGEGLILAATFEGAEREITGARISGYNQRAVSYAFDFLEPGDGLIIRVVHSGAPGDLHPLGSVVGLPQGLTTREPEGLLHEWRRTASFVTAGLIIGTTGLGFFDYARRASWQSIGAAAITAVLFCGGFALTIYLERAWQKRKVGSVPRVILADPELRDRLYVEFP